MLVPIKVIELANIPPELRMAAGVPAPAPADKAQQAEAVKRLRKAIRKKQAGQDALAAATRLYVEAYGPVKTVTDVEQLKVVEDKLRSKAHPDFGKFTYGQWYLPQSMWHKRDVDAPGLQDPRQDKTRQATQTQRKNHQLEESLAMLEGTNAFAGFVERQSRKPEVRALG